MTDHNHDRQPDEDTAPSALPNAPSHASMPEWYPNLLDSVTQRISLGRLSATAAITRELIATKLDNW